MNPESNAEAFKDLQAGLPDKIGDWRALPEEDRTYDHETIFDYIDGAGEIYRAYDMRSCLSRRYSSPEGPPLVLDIFDMGSSENAFGVFTHDREGEVLDVGQGALYRPGWLSFWKDRFFVSIYAEVESAASEKAVRELGRRVAALVKAEGPKPSILTSLPPEGLKESSIRTFRHHTILNTHFYLSDENLLNLGPETDAVLADYRSGGQGARLLLVRYPDKEKAALALSRFLRAYLPEAGAEGLLRLENGKWTAAWATDDLLAVVLEAESRQLAEDLLKKMREGFP